MKNSIIGTVYIANNVNLIFNTYAFLFLKLLLIIFVLLDSFYHARRVSKTTRIVDRKGSEICFARNTQNYNGAKMIDLWNVKKLMTARTKMEVGKSRTKGLWLDVIEFRTTAPYLIFSLLN